MRFKLLYEHYNRRFNSFGFQPGDLVKFKKNATSHPYVQSGSELYQNAVKALIEKDVPLHLIRFLEDRPSNPNLYGIYAVVAPEIGPLMPSQDTFTVPTDLLEVNIMSHEVATQDQSKYISDTTGKYKKQDAAKAE